uniref:Uncharacterized protein n=1 Tax=Panagrolaimus superbus TaxID=310955 RepID=A0A914YGY6_9BILA
MNFARPGLAKDKAKRIVEVRRFIQNIQTLLTEKRGIIDLTEKKIEETEKEVGELKARKEALTKETFAEFCKKNNINDLSAFQNEDVELQKDYSEKKTKIENEIKNLQNELQYITDARTDERSRAETNLQAAKNRLEELREVWKKARDECNEKHSQFLKFHTELEEREKDIEENQRYQK